MFHGPHQREERVPKQLNMIADNWYGGPPFKWIRQGPQRTCICRVCVSVCLRVHGVSEMRRGRMCVCVPLCLGARHTFSSTSLRATLSDPRNKVPGFMGPRGLGFTSQKTNKLCYWSHLPPNPVPSNPTLKLIWLGERIFLSPPFLHLSLPAVGTGFSNRTFHLYDTAILQSKFDALNLTQIIDEPTRYHPKSVNTGTLISS